MALSAFLRSAMAEEPASGNLFGRVRSAPSGVPLPNANVMLFHLAAPNDSVGTQITGTFALAPEGKYRLTAAAGRYRLLVTHVSHHPANVLGVEILPGTSAEVDIALFPSVTTTIRTISVRAKAIRNTEAALLTQHRKSVSVGDALSAEQITKSGDSDAAEALQRVSGLSLVDNRYVFVRGLGERYSSTQINGSTIGSPEPNKRVVPLDLIPAALVDNITIQKTYTPDQPAEFGGGSVNINTRDFPGHRTWSISLGAGNRPGTTGGTFYTYRGGRLDFLGFDDGSRALPSLVAAMTRDQKVAPRGIGGDRGFTPEEIAAMGRAFAPIWGLEKTTALPAYDVSATYGNEYQVMRQPLGILLGGVFRSGYDTYDHEENTYEPGADGKLSKRTSYHATTSKFTAHSGLVGNISYRTDSHTTLSLRSIYNRMSDDEVRRYEGLNVDHGVLLRDTRLRYVARSLWSSNFGAVHRFAARDGVELSWHVNYSRAALDEPDRREYIYEYREREEGEGQWEISRRSNSQGFTRMYGAVRETERVFDCHLALPFSLPVGRKARAKIGCLYKEKNREAGYRRFAFKTPARGVDLTQPPESLMTPENIGGTLQTFRLHELTRATDSYDASHNMAAFYCDLNLQLTTGLRAAGGIRIEEWEQKVKTFDAFVPDGDVISVVIKKTEYLPAINLIHAVSRRTNLRAAYSATISRPDLRELSPFELTDYSSGYAETGNPELKRAWIRNYDLRAEHFPSNNELLAASLFYKQIIDPIEKTLQIAGAQLRKFPDNGEGSYLYGAELEGRINLARLGRRWSSFRLAANYCWVKSQTELGKYGVQASSKRPLEGQSPYVMNLLLYYAPQSGIYSASLLYNAHGRRLSGVGAMALPDIYEEPLHRLDLTGTLKLGRASIKLTVKNLLDDEKCFKQSGYTVHRGQPGRSVSLKLSTGCQR
ncbi:MAG: outer membrane beta-barrel protein [Candidatus Eisenbacteria sp.]|nr:outer membrane beta-barrel protein [Candidatus Eisenbacteria bacterium]